MMDEDLCNKANGFIVLFSDVVAQGKKNQTF
jgi:hypothetical protein